MLTNNGGESWKQIMETLETIAGCSYEISWEKMNTKENGVPQNRVRIYIVGVLKRLCKGAFDFSSIKPVPCPSIEHFLDPRKGRSTEEDLPPTSQGHAHGNVKRVIRLLKKAGHDPLREPWIIDCDSTEKFCTQQLDCTPCITRRRGGGHWVTNRGRRFTKPEMMRLQGMVPENFKVVVSETQLGNHIGNSMSVNVLERIFARLLQFANLVPEGKVLRDRWEALAKRRELATCDLAKASKKRNRDSSPHFKRHNRIKIVMC